MGADISWNSHKITSLADPTVNQDAATKKYVDDNIGVGDNLGNHTATTNLDMSGYDIVGIDNFYAAGTEIDVYDDIDVNWNNVKNINNILQMNNVNTANINSYPTNSGITIGEDLDVNGEIDCFDIYPNQSDYRQCGLSTRKWSDVYCTTLHEGDHVFAERKCVLCDKEFKKGETIVNYVLSNTEEGTRTIPVHLNCVIKEKEQA